MRTSLLALLLASSPAFADVRRTPAPRPTAPRPPGMTPPVTKAPASNLPPIDLDDVPPPCKATAKQGGAANPKVALPARISLARCIADTNLAPLQLLDCEDSIIAIDDATKASFELLAGVVAGTTDAVQQIIAERAKAELYDQMMVRMRQTLPSPGTTEAEIAMHEARKGILEGLLARGKPRPRRRTSASSRP